MQWLMISAVYCDVDVELVQLKKAKLKFSKYPRNCPYSWTIFLVLRMYFRHNFCLMLFCGSFDLILRDEALGTEISMPYRIV